MSACAKKIFEISRVVFILSIFLYSLPTVVSAATLSISPAGAGVTSGDLATIRLALDSGGTAINNAEGTLRFPVDLLRVVSISKSPSIFSLWVSEPVFSNTAGTISFNGGVPSPGFSGSNGTVFTVTFETKKVGSATLSITDAFVRANDGEGTNVLNQVFGGSISIAQPSSVTSPPSTPPSSNIESKGIQISSATHPDQTRWYQNGEPIFGVTLPSSATLFEMNISTSSKSLVWNPVPKPYSSVSVGELGSGIWHLSVRGKTGTLKNSPATYTFRIDRTLPTFVDTSFSYDTKNNQFLINAIATDTDSGIKEYTLLVDSSNLLHLPENVFTEGVYAMDGGSVGAHHVTLSAIDAAGNTSTISSSYVVPAKRDTESGGLSGLILSVIAIVILLSAAALFVALRTYRAVHTRATHIESHVQKVVHDTHHTLVVFGRQLIQDIEAIKRVQKIRGLSAEEKETLRMLLRETAVLEREVIEKIHRVEMRER